MPHSLVNVIPYDPERRQLTNTNDIGQTELFPEHLIAFIRGAFRIDSAIIVREESQRARFRMLFAMLPEKLLFEELPLEMKPMIIDHLLALNIEPSDSLVSAIKCICEHFQKKRCQNTRKLGITDIYTKFPVIFRDLMRTQGSRCFYCGVNLTYGGNATLDHKWPFHLGDDPSDGSNWCFSCAQCNTGKGEYPAYALDTTSLNWISSTAQKDLTLAVRYAALSRDASCIECGIRPTEGELVVRKKIESGCWILDNTEAVCVQCFSQKLTR
jgi:5-methylcytosine-specific restriction endonuclease McrA